MKSFVQFPARLGLLFFVVLFTAVASQAEMYIRSYDEARHSRFYQGGDKDFIGAGYDLSGVGRDDDLAKSGAEQGFYYSPWATMVSDSFFVTAEHWAPAVGNTVTFYANNDPNGTARTYTVAELYSTTSSDGKISDAMLGRLTTAVASDIQKYKVATADSVFAGTEAILYGNEQYGNGVVENIAGRVGVNTVEYTELYVSTWNRTSEVVWYQYDEPANGDEAQVIGGDSGAPSFLDHYGQLALVGTHWLGLPNGTGAPVEGQWGADVLLAEYVDQMDVIMASYGENLTMTPEPATMMMLTVGGLMILRRKKRNAA
jgi:hypothetical protein